MADKFIFQNAGVLTEKAFITTSAGVGDSGKGIGLDNTGRIDNSMMPVGIGAETQVIAASEALAAGDFVNIWNSGDTVKVRKSDATSSGKEAHGFVLSAVISGANATVYFLSQTNTSLVGLTPGTKYFISTTAGTISVTPPAGTGNVVQSVGYAGSATALVFRPSDPIVLA